MYSQEGTQTQRHSTLKRDVQSWLTRALSDPIVKIVAKQSHLTSTQLETLLIDLLVDHLYGKGMKYDEKSKFRLTKAKITRGAFNRTLRQAKENVIKAIYTLLLLGYLGVLESTTLDPYFEIANKLKTYMEAYKSIPETVNQQSQHLKVMKVIREELQAALERLSHP